MDLARVKRAASRLMEEQVPDRAAALAYYGFLAVPSVLILALGVVGLVAEPDDVRRLLDKTGDVMPPEAVTLLNNSIGRVAGGSSDGVLMVIAGFALAMWSGSGAMNALMRALNAMYRVDEGRSFVRQRTTAMLMLVWTLVAVALVVVLLILGPALSGWIGDAIDHPGLTKALWWTLQWPVLVGGIMLSFGGMLFLGPDRRAPWRVASLGAVVATVLWLAISGLFALYTSRLGSFNAAWGSLSVVVVTLMWLWLSAIALLLGAGIDAEVDDPERT